mmetsp:Transcript_19837/g.59461  ORF Transcript_19837/g.59461 Transcript_19837/m.59461 type:complete len:804 (-) Transcript_19837:182-2593(-)
MAAAGMVPAEPAPGAALSPRRRNTEVALRNETARMLTFDSLVTRGNVTERNVLRKVIRKNTVRAAGCMTLPLTIAYCLFYCFATRLHEDIMNVYLTESTIRRRTDEIFVHVNSVGEIWEALLGKERFLDVFFQQTDIYGVPLPKQTDDRWGLWGRVEQFNQLQGAVRFQQSRRTSAPYGEPYNCSDPIACDMCRQGQGFVPNSQVSTSKHEFDCGAWGRNDSAPSRRLRLGRVELRSSLLESKPEEDRFAFWLFPSEPQEAIRSRLEYLRRRRWLDRDTHEVQIRMYLMNAELGRPRLEQLTLTFTADAAGGVAFERDLQAIFLEFYNSKDVTGKYSMMADLCFILVLAASSLQRTRHMWKAFLQQSFLCHMYQPHTVCECLIVLFGWYNVYGFYVMKGVADRLTWKLQVVRDFGWDLDSSNLDIVEDLFSECEKAAIRATDMRVIFGQYSMVLMFRFFVSFGSQARLAVVLKTMKAVMTDLLHFMIVFIPTFMAYAITGSLVFGRRIEAFSTIQGSIGRCFRIVFESDYDWEEMSAEFYWAAAMWAWSFLILVVLLMLNLVLAIILDVYSEVRETSFVGEAIWETIGNFFLRLLKSRTWVRDHAIEEKFKGHSGTSDCIVTRAAMSEAFPDMPVQQLNLIFRQCSAEMKWDSSALLDRMKLLKLAGTLIGDVEKTDKVLHTMNDEADPVQPWTKAQGAEEGAEAQPLLPRSEHFLSGKVATKGNKAPTFVCEEKADSIGGVFRSRNVDADFPDWLQDIYSTIAAQKQWLRSADWQLEQMQHLIQAAHLSRALDGEGGHLPPL